MTEAVQLVSMLIFIGQKEILLKANRILDRFQSSANSPRVLLSHGFTHKPFSCLKNPKNPNGLGRAPASALKAPTPGGRWAGAEPPL